MTSNGSAGMSDSWKFLPFKLRAYKANKITDIFVVTEMPDVHRTSGFSTVDDGGKLYIKSANIYLSFACENCIQRISIWFSFLAPDFQDDSKLEKVDAPEGTLKVFPGKLQYKKLLAKFLQTLTSAGPSVFFVCPLYWTAFSIQWKFSILNGPVEHVV